jgi:hypothetical protein
MDVIFGVVCRWSESGDRDFVLKSARVGRHKGAIRSLVGYFCDLEFELSQSKHVAVTQGVRLQGGETFAVDTSAVGAVEVFNVDAIKTAVDASVLARHPIPHPFILGKVYVRVDAPSLIAPAHVYERGDR